MINIIILYALFASTFSLGKVLLLYAQPIFLVGIRMSIAGIVLLLYQYFHKNTVFRFERSHWPLYLQGIFFTCYIPYILRFWGLRHMSSSKASLIYSLGPFISYLFGYLLAKENISFKKIFGLLIGFAGLLPILMVPTPKEDIFGGIGFFSWAEISIVLSITSLSYGWIVMKKLIKDNNYAPAMVNGICMFAGGIMALLTSWLTEHNSTIIDFSSFLGILAVVVIVSNLICHNLYGALLKKYSPTFLSFASFLTPLFAALYGWAFLHEKISIDFFISTGFVILGLCIFYQGELQQKMNDEKEKLKTQEKNILDEY